MTSWQDGVLQEDPSPVDKKTVLYKEQVARTRSSILNVFLGRRGAAGNHDNKHLNNVKPTSANLQGSTGGANKQSSLNSSANKQSSLTSSATLQESAGSDVDI
jgi:hypothetical protein